MTDKEAGKFSVIYAVLTPESVEQGLPVDCGHLGHRLSLRDALAMFEEERTGGPVVPNESPPSTARCFTDDGMNGASFAVGTIRSVSLVLPEHATGSSRGRIAQLIGCSGTQPKR